MVKDAEEEGAYSLSPVGFEVADPIVEEGRVMLEEKDAMIEFHLDLLVRRLEIESCADEGAGGVIGLEGEAYVECHGQRHSFRWWHLGLTPMVESKTRRESLFSVELADGDVAEPVDFGLFFCQVGLNDPSGFDFFDERSSIASGSPHAQMPSSESGW